MSNLEKLINQGNWGGFFDAIDVNRDGTLSHQDWAPRDVLAVLDFLVSVLRFLPCITEVGHQKIRPWRKNRPSVTTLGTGTRAFKIQDG